MHINFFLIPFVIVLGILFSNNDTKKNRLWYIILCSIVLVFVAAMRSPEWMSTTYNLDTDVYKDLFKVSIDMKWGELWSMALLKYSGVSDEGDIGFLVLNKFLGWLTKDFYIFSILIDLLFFVPFGILLYRYSTRISQLVFAYIFYIALLQVFLIGGGRQISAIGFDMMALISLMDKKTIRAIILFLLGVTMHLSSFLFALPLLMIWYQTKPATLKKMHLVSFLLFPIVLMFPNQIIVFMGESVGMERYARYGEGGIQGGIGTFIILIELLSLFCLIAIKKKDLQSSYMDCVFYVMAPLLTFFAPLIRANGSMIRISLYYHIYLIFLVPFAIDCMFKKENRSTVYVVAIATLSLLTVMGGGMVYYFHWQL